jgi:hypothetical protein
MSDRTEEHAALESLGAPAGPDVVERVTAERLNGQPRLRAVEPVEVDLHAKVAGLESQLTEERAARKKAESAANEMAVLVANVRNELAEVKQARDAAEQTAGEMAALIAQEHERVRKAEDELRLAWAQVPMVDQHELSPAKTPLGARVKRAMKR